MQSKKFAKAGLLAVTLIGAFVFCWEAYWRSKGFIPTHNDDKVLWANKRKQVYQTKGDATIFIGSSRIKYDLDIPTWEKRTGEKAVQLALVGTSPRLMLQDLANDKNFTGKLVIDVTEILFFSQNPVFQKSAKDALEYYKDQTPSQKLSSLLNSSLESKLAFLEEQNFSMTALLNDMEIPNRKGVFSFPVFPKGFGWTTVDRQTYMSPYFLADTSQLNWQTSIWEKLVLGDPTPPPSDSAVYVILEEVKAAVENIKARGGKVIFVRTPSSGPMAEAEQKAFPRSAYWDVLLQFSNSKGIHYADYPETANMICPEWSHLSPADAITYTNVLIEILEKEDWFTPGYSSLHNQ